MDTRPRQWAWIGRLRPAAVDRTLVVVLLLFGLLTLLDLRFAEQRVFGPFGIRAGLAVAAGASLVLLALQTVPLLWRRQRPSIVLLLVAGAFAAKLLLGLNPGAAILGLLIAMYSVAAYGGARRAVFLVVAGLGFLAGFVAFGVTQNPRSFAVSVPSLFFVGAWLIGDYLRTRRAYVAQLEERAARLERDRDQESANGGRRGASPDRPRAPRCGRT